MSRENVDITLASSPANVFYVSDIPCTCTAPNRLLFTVFQASPVYCLLTRAGAVKLIITNSALELASKTSWINDIITYRTGTYIVRPQGVSTQNQKLSSDALIETLKENKPKVLALEKPSLTFELHEKIRKSLPDTKLVDATPLFKELRMIKTNEEIKRFKEATRILCSATMKVINSIEKGITELELHNILKTTILGEGGDSWHQTTIAAGPENGPDIFNQASKRKIIPGDIIRLDVGCLYQGYTADNARTVAVKPVTREAEKIYDAVKKATDIAIDAMKPGIKVCEIHRMITDVVKQKYDLNYTRGNVGHGVGVELYDDPEITSNNTQELLPGMTISVEAPYHKLGLGGFIVEDSILITDKGCKDLTTMSRELFVV